jgi:PAS domain S-box-containing protein
MGIDDVTGHKELDRRLAAIVESSDDAILSKTLDGTIVSWNSGAERIYGYTAHEIIGRPVAILAPAGYDDEMLAIIGRISGVARS